MNKLVNLLVGVLVGLGGCSIKCPPKDNLLVGFSGIPFSGSIENFVKDVGEKIDSGILTTDNSLENYRKFLGCANDKKNIDVLGYSQGCTSAILYCQRLNEKGIDVDNLFLIDPTFTRNSIEDWFKIPNNIDSIKVYRNLDDKDDYCRGHSLDIGNFQDPNTFKRYSEERVSGTHWQMPSSSDLKERIVKEIE